MFYDDAIEVRNKPIHKLSPDATDAEADEWKRQLDLLEESTPIFDVDNLFETLNPTLIEASNPAADKRNAEKNIREVEKATGASARGLTAIMNVLVNLNFLSKDARRAATPSPLKAAPSPASTKPSFQGGVVKHCSEQLIPR